MLGIRRIDRVLNARIRELNRVKKGLDERIDESVLRWLGHVDRMENDGIFKRVYVGDRAGNCPVVRPRKRLIESVKECLEKRSLDGRQARRMGQDRCEWRGLWERMHGA